MKKFKYWAAYLVVFTMIFTSCSKDETSSLDEKNDVSSVNLSFGATLDNLANRAMNKGHFDQVPTCSDAAPAVAVINFSYGGNDYEATVDILTDGNEFYTDYSEALKIPVPANGSTTVTLTGFKVYDGIGAGNGTLIWIAPTAPGNFAGYIDNPLPFQFDVLPGTKPYIDVEVLCFDRRMVNEYGYVFFDILPEEVYPLCFFANLCLTVDGRHYVGNYSVALFYDDGVTPRIPLYTDERPLTGNYGTDENPNYYAKPVCLVVPGAPEGFDSDDPYLYYVITPLDWPKSYGDISNNPLPEVGLSWDDVEGLFNDDGETSEYVHLFIGCEEEECPVTPQDTDGDCVPDTDDECVGDNRIDSDADGIPDACDDCPRLAGVPELNGCPLDDCDGDLDRDGVKNCEDDCPTIPGPVSNGGCPDECLVDSDDDGVLDCEDDCPLIPGPKNNDGCPTPSGHGCDTAWMWGDHTWTKKDDDGLSTSGKWGWAEYWSDNQDMTEFAFYAGAGNNKIDPSKKVGMVTIDDDGDLITVTVTVEPGVDLNSLAIYLSDAKPTKGAPGQFNFKDANPSSINPNVYEFTNSGDFWIAVHGDVCR